MKAVVTGGAGFIGSHLVDELLRRGHGVISIDDYSAGKVENLELARSYPEFLEIRCDITDLVDLRRQFPEGVDVVFNNAAAKKTSYLKDPDRGQEVNVGGTFNVLRLAKERDVKKFVHVSSGSVYGEPRHFPQDEDHPKNPTSLYGMHKLAGEVYAKTFGRLHSLNVTILRYFHVYGPRQDCSDVGGVVPIFIRRVVQGQPPVIFGDGTQQRSFTYVDDVVHANLCVLPVEGRTYNVASGIKVTIKELADRVLVSLDKEHLGVEYDDWTPGDVRVFDVDNSKLRSLGWRCQLPFIEGLDRTIAWYRQHLTEGGKSW
jgi:nucleoside-diphosphate-sugar epimerase